MSELVESIKEEVLSQISDSPRLTRAFQRLLGDPEVLSLLEMANIVLVRRLKYNDHGLIHALITTRNALRIIDILGPENLDGEGWRDFEDSRLIVMVASFLHDIGNAIHREEHEVLSVVLARPYVRRILEDIYADLGKLVKMESMIYEAMLAHMGKFPPTSVEGGVVATADGCDMEEERARIPFRLGGQDIHKYSALAIRKVEIERGDDKPVRIRVLMRDPSGIFQVQEILLKKIRGGNFERFVEVYASIDGRETIRFI